MTTGQYFLNLALLAWILSSNLGTRTLTRRRSPFRCSSSRPRADSSSTTRRRWATTAFSSSRRTRRRPAPRRPSPPSPCGCAARRPCHRPPPASRMPRLGCRHRRPEWRSPTVPSTGSPRRRETFAPTTSSPAPTRELPPSWSMALAIVISRLSVTACCSRGCRFARAATARSRPPTGRPRSSVDLPRPTPARPQAQGAPCRPHSRRPAAAPGPPTSGGPWSLPAGLPPAIAVGTLVGQPRRRPATSANGRRMMTTVALALWLVSLSLRVTDVGARRLPAGGAAARRGWTASTRRPGIHARFHGRRRPRSAAAPTRGAGSVGPFVVAADRLGQGQRLRPARRSGGQRRRRAGTPAGAGRLAGARSRRPRPGAAAAAAAGGATGRP